MVVAPRYDRRYLSSPLHLQHDLQLPTLSA